MDDREHAKEARLRLLRELKDRLEKRAFFELAGANGAEGTPDYYRALIRAEAAKVVSEEVSGLLRDEEYET